MRGKRAKVLRRIARDFTEESGYGAIHHKRGDRVHIEVQTTGQRRYYQWLKRVLKGVPIPQLRRRIS